MHITYRREAERERVLSMGHGEHGAGSFYIYRDYMEYTDVKDQGATHHGSTLGTDPSRLAGDTDARAEAKRLQESLDAMYGCGQAGPQRGRTIRDVIDDATQQANGQY